MGIFDNVLCGLLAGLIATVPMTFVMFLLFYYMPKKEKFSLPSFHATKFFTRKLGIKNYIDPPKHRVLTFVNHFGYGAIAGGIFAAVEHYVPNHFVLKGLVFGLVVWAFSYFVLMPSVGLFPMPDRKPVRFNLLMIGAHIVWGLFLVLCYLFFMKECGFGRL